MKISKFVLAAIAFVGINKVHADIQYQITDLGSLGGANSFAYAINSDGQIVGGSQTADGVQHAFLYSNGKMTDLGTLGGISSVANGINDSGQIVGESNVSPYFSHAFLYNNNHMIDLTPGNGNSSAKAINSSGQIVGNSNLSTGIQAFIYSNGIVSQLGPLPGDNEGLAYAINAGGQVAGLSLNANDPALPIHAFTYGGGNIANINSSAPFDTFANAINANGDIVGETMGNVFLYSNSDIINLGTLGGDNGSAYGINAAGIIVGSSETADSDIDAFVYNNQTMTDLNTLIDASLGWHLESATAINDSGEIVGYGENFSNGNIDAFVLTPTSEPSAILSPEPGSAWLLLVCPLLTMHRRRKVH